MADNEFKAIDLSYHLSDIAKARAPSPLKEFHRYWGRPGMISLAGGLPNPAYFPFESVTGEALLPDTFSSSGSKTFALSWLWNLFSKGDVKPTTPITVPKYATEPGDVNLAAALQYHVAAGIPAIQEIVQEFSAKVYRPAYADFKTLVHTGNTDGLYKAVTTLCNPGEGILVEEWTFPSAMAGIRPIGVTPVPVALDSQGIRSDDLLKVLSEWDVDARGMRRPHVLYTIPVGQNPTGTTMEAVRKKEIYDICVQFDLIIVEDDPYYFLQEGAYRPKWQRQAGKTPPKDDEAYIANLVPSFLRFDYQGRVIRLDTFSKTIAPGSRLGWFTCNPLFAERLERQGEVSTQAPCGFSQSLVAKLLLTWKYDGYIHWLRALGTEYTTRRDQFLDCLGEEFCLKLEPLVGGEPHHYVAFLKSSGPTISNTLNEKSFDLNKQVFSFVPPSSGMFLWIKVPFDECPAKPDDGETLEIKLWTLLAEAGLLIAPGYIFNPVWQTDIKEGHYRFSFSDANHDNMKRGIRIFERILRQFFTEK